MGSDRQHQWVVVDQHASDLAAERARTADSDVQLKSARERIQEYQDLFESYAEALGMPGAQSDTALVNEARRLRSLVNPSDDRDPPTEERTERNRLRESVAELRQSLRNAVDMRNNAIDAARLMTRKIADLEISLREAGKEHRREVEARDAEIWTLKKSLIQVSDRLGRVALVSRDMGILSGLRDNTKAQLAAIGHLGCGIPEQLNQTIDLLDRLLAGSQP